MLACAHLCADHVTGRAQVRVFEHVLEPPPLPHARQQLQAQGCTFSFDQLKQSAFESSCTFDPGSAAGFALAARRTLDRDGLRPDDEPASRYRRRCTARPGPLPDSRNLRKLNSFKATKHSISWWRTAGRPPTIFARKSSHAPPLVASIRSMLQDASTAVIRRLRCDGVRFKPSARRPQAPQV